MGIKERVRFSPSWSIAARSMAQAALLGLMVGTAGAQARTVVHRTPLEYPTLAVRMKVAGTVTVLTTIDSSGTVTDAKAIVGHALLRQAAEKAVLRWKFSAAPKPTTANVDVHFELE